MNVTPIVPRPALTAATARELTDSIKADIEKLWGRLLRAYEQDVHRALGYPSFAAYCKAEFDIGQSRAYQLVDAGRVVKAIEGHSTTVETPESERVARTLVPLLRKGENVVAEAWDKVVAEHGPEPTAEETRAVVNKRTERPQPRRKRLTSEQNEFGRNLSAMENCAEYVTSKLASRTKEQREHGAQLIDVDDETLQAWLQMVRVIDNAARQLRRRLNEQKGETT